MKQEDVKKVEQELNEEELDGASGGVDKHIKVLEQ